MIEIPNARKKRMKPRRKFMRKGEKPLFVMENGQWKALTATSIKCESIDGSLQKARQQAMAWRGIVPRAEIHIRRGHRIVITTHNPKDTYMALSFHNLLMKRFGR